VSLKPDIQMAKYISSLGGQISGKVGSAVFSKNGTVRGAIFPVNPKSTAQSVIRSIFTIVSQAWALLNGSNRTTWISAAGESISEAKQLFQQNVSNVVQTGGALLTNWVANATSADQSTFLAAALAGNVTVDIAAGLGTVEINFLPDPLPAGTALIVQMTQPLKAGRMGFQDSDYRTVTALPAATASGTDIASAYGIKFPNVTLTAAQTIGMRCKLIDTASGYATEFVGSTSIVGA
jgi:hypothetical protein